MHFKLTRPVVKPYAFWNTKICLNWKKTYPLDFTDNLQFLLTGSHSLFMSGFQPYRDNHTEEPRGAVPSPG